MKRILFFLLVIFEFISLAQNGDVNVAAPNSFVVSVETKEIQFEKNKIGNYEVIDFYQYTDPSRPGTFKLPSQYLTLAIPPNSKPQFEILEKSVGIIKSAIPAINPKIIKKNDSTIITEPVSINNVKRMPIEPVIQVLGYFWLRGFYCVRVKINTYNFNPSNNQITYLNKIRFRVNFEKSFSFKSNDPIKIKSPYDKVLKNIIFNSDIAEQFRSSSSLSISDTTDSWIHDYNSTYIKIGVAIDGLFRIYKSDLEKFGINVSSIDSKTFQLFNYGKEIPIYVEGETSGILSDSGFLQFYGTKNYNKISHRIINNSEQEYNEYLNRYTDTSYYFLTWGIENGIRAGEINTFQNGLTDTLHYFNEVNHYEDNTMFQNLFGNEVENQMANWNRNKSSYWGWVFVQKKSFGFQTPNLYPGKPVNFYIKLVSAGSNTSVNSHNVSFYVNNTKLDSQVVDRFQQIILSGTVNSNQLTGSNQIVVQNYDNGTNPNFLAYDWYDVEYPKYLELINDSLLFSFNNISNPGARILKITNVQDENLVIFKVKPSLKKINNFLISNNNLYFTDTVKNGDSYIIITHSKIKKPVFYYKKDFLDLRNQNSQVDYLAITHPKFLQAAENYVNDISSIYSINAKLVNVQDIYDEFGYGYPTPESIKLFVENSLQNWKNPKPSYMVLIGDANYDYKYYLFENTGVIGGGNYVPSYGNPVSDNWYGIFNDSLPIPQIMIGRIPINNSSELNHYLSKVENNFNSPYDAWNKRYLFFSGGNGDNPSELTLLKSANQTIINNYIIPKPIAGHYNHFYKTANPQSDFGPYSHDQVNDAISKGGVFISYIGHSGTSTWDNSINTVSQLENDVNRNPLISDFGCSTVKFAEPNIVSFGESFLLDNGGQAIGYVGNSSLGFTSTATSVPNYFYQSLFEDSLRNIGLAHLNAKIKMFNTTGASGVNKIFAYTNSLLGDPVIDLKIPTKPNFKIKPSDFLITSNSLNENLDSVEVKIIIENLGIAANDSLRISLTHLIYNEILKTKTIVIPMPDYKDTLSLWFQTKNLPGEHKILVDLDPGNKIGEIYENDNSSSFSFNVSSAAVRDINLQESENPLVQEIKLLNPTSYSGDSLKIEYQISTDKNFQDFNEYIINAQPFVTKIKLPALQNNRRYWIRFKVMDSSTEFSSPKSFYNSTGSKFYLIDSVSFKAQKENNVNFEKNVEKLTLDSIKISVISAGFYVGATCVISKNSKNLLANSFFAGMGIVVFDKNTLEIDTTAWYQLFANPPAVQQLTNLINSIPQGKIVAMGVADDAENNMNSALRNAIKSLGSTKIDSLQFRGSWALIGEKGVSPGKVIEMVKGPFDGIVSIDSTFIIPNRTGTLTTKLIGPATAWENFRISSSASQNSEIKFRILGLNSNDTLDSLSYLTLNNNDSTYLNFIDPKKYQYIKVLSEFYAGDNNASPEIFSLGVDYESVPELGTNYQVVSVSQDTVEAGETNGLEFYVYNAGESSADSFKVKAEVIKPDNSRIEILNENVASLASETRKLFNATYENKGTGGDYSFHIEIDPENKILEMYEDNNIYDVSFYAKGDTNTLSVSPTNFSAKYDGAAIMDGEYISNKPKIEMTLNYPVWFSPDDTSSVEFYLDNEKIPYSALQISYNDAARMNKYVFSPQLSDGGHILKVYGVNNLGVLQAAPGYEKFFLVSNEVKLLDVYNYPNPFSGYTYFTFKLTQIPEQLRIKIYTIAGRLIREITKTSSELNFDFNKIYWDGRDEDGDLIANGVYLYKIIMKKGSETETAIQKLAVVR